MATQNKIIKRGKTGEAPGTLMVSDAELKPTISVFTIDSTGAVETPMENVEELSQFIAEKSESLNWVQVKGLGDQETIKAIVELFGLNTLVLEDIIDPAERPKYEEYDDFVFGISRLIIYDDEFQAANSQFSMVVKKKLLVSFQENYEEYFGELKKRMTLAKGAVKDKDSGYLFYALLDTIYDRYFDLLDSLEEALAKLEEAIDRNPSRNNMLDAQRIKRVLILLNRATWPERDKMSEILRSDNPLITKKDKIYMRDAYDHCIDIIETVHAQKDLATNLTDIYLSTVNNQMNDVMRILTIVSAIFIPLSFIASLYGMNFAHTDPVTGKVLEHNMPELYNPHGYRYTLFAMGLITAIQLIIFWRKGWFNRLK